MDYSKVKFVTPSVSEGHFKKGNAYSFDNGGQDVCGGFVNNDRGINCYIHIPKCAYLSDNPWIPCHEDGAPLITRKLTVLEAEMLAMLEDIHSELINGETPHAYKIEELIKKAKQ